MKLRNMSDSLERLIRGLDILSGPCTLGCNLQDPPMVKQIHAVLNTNQGSAADIYGKLSLHMS